ncbi:TIGR03620 family F420-dependent LLM class oxidoreductase [Occultella aeris]|uniref:Luciferase-like monooxygenase n=1 Tax=Occultella aeris TaxID=2761496 RepID=A0A7M4DGA9_9MICO|nr:TIGR03620 family F420-dependent LLM class oxidoreductase [Occultella aeris]VZO35952.1 Luciferase-like monooxygenase [Occultella aeris]
MDWTNRLGRYGVWRGKDELDVPLAQTIERLGFGTIWQGSSPGSDLRLAEEVLDGTESVVVATAIVNIWQSDPTELADSYRIVARHPGRLLLGIGSGHREATPERTRPLEATTRYLDTLDAGGVPNGDRLISALGPKMLAIAAARSGGTHPYLTVPAQTREARDLTGNSMLIAPEQTVVIDADPVSARRAARDFLAGYLKMVNYVGNMRRAGFTRETSPTEEATGWSTPSWRTATRQRSPRASERTSMPARTTSACRCSPPPQTSPPPSSASPANSSSPEEAAARRRREPSASTRGAEQGAVRGERPSVVVWTTEPRGTSSGDPQRGAHVPAVFTDCGHEGLTPARVGTDRLRVAGATPRSSPSINRIPPPSGASHRTALHRTGSSAHKPARISAHRSGLVSRLLRR